MPELHITDANFEQEVLHSDIPVFIDFWAPWCGPCQMMGPMVEELANEFDSSKVKIAKINVDENPVAAGKYQIMSIPTFLMIKGGEVVGQLVGGVTKERLRELINSHI
jgi:thioredoxin 1